MYCPKCGTENFGNFCTKCGTPLAKIKQNDFVPEDTFGFQPDEEYFPDPLDETVMLEPLEEVEPGMVRMVYHEESEEFDSDLEEDYEYEEEQTGKKRGARAFEDDDDERPGFFRRFGKGHRSDDDEAYDDGEVEDYRKGERLYSKYGNDPYAHVDDEREEEDEWLDEEEERRGKKAKKKKGNPVSATLRTICFLMTVGITVFYLMALYVDRIYLGEASLAIEEGNTAMFLYFGLIGLVFLVGFVSAIRILTRKKRYENKKLISYDSGRGFGGFFLLTLVTVLAAFGLSYIPRTPEFLVGLILFLQVTLSFKTVFLGTGIAGMVLCLIRKAIK